MMMSRHADTIRLSGRPTKRWDDTANPSAQVGFVSVIIPSVIFALGLPLVLL